MATFDLNYFIKQPSVEKLDSCQRDDLYIIAQHYDMLYLFLEHYFKKNVKACLLAGLEKGGIIEQGKPLVAAIEFPVGPVTFCQTHICCQLWFCFT